MPTLDVRYVALLATLAVGAPACSFQVSAVPPALPSSAASGCPQRVLTVHNPTPAAVNVFIDRKIQGGMFTSTLIGTVDSGSTSEFRLSPADGNRIDIAWASGSGSGLQVNQDLGRVRHKIRCETESREFL